MLDDAGDDELLPPDVDDDGVMAIEASSSSRLAGDDDVPPMPDARGPEFGSDRCSSNSAGSCSMKYCMKSLTRKSALTSRPDCRSLAESSSLLVLAWSCCSCCSSSIVCRTKREKLRVVMSFSPINERVSE